MDHFVEHFRNEVRRVSIGGVNGEDQVVPYVQYSALKDYWTEERVNDIVNCPTPPIAVSPVVIIEKYLQIFSTLVYVGFCDKILWFFRDTKYLDDHNLPFDAEVFKRTADWSLSFLEHQWMFCAADVANRQYHKRIVGSKFILPVTNGEDIRAIRTAPDGATLRKYQLHSDSPSIKPKVDHVVFKVYQGHDGEVRYNAETDVYMKLHKHPHDCIVKHVASFEFQAISKFVIILEYAESGSLLDYLETTPLPVTPEELYSLWEGLFELLDALYLLSNIYRQNRNEPKTLAGYIQDNPKYLADPCSPFDVQFKLTDFGLARMGRVSSVDGRLSTRDRGNRTYIAPEVFPNFRVQDSCDTPISPQADVWSMGALFSDVLVWTITGEHGREKYRLRREKEIERYLHLRSAGFDCCFHDSERRLKAVDDQHNEVLQYKRGIDTLSPRISELILDHMLVGSRDRLEAIDIRKFHLGRFLGTAPSKSDEIMDLPGMEEARSKISENDGRDQILLFDDCGSMHKHKKKAMKTARVISYIAKEADNDGMEVYAASRTAKGPIICKNSTDVESAIGKFKTVPGTCKLKKCLEDILKRVLKEHNFKPTSIYIFTDGIWEPGDDQIKAVIKRAIKFLIQHQLSSSELMFQFVQFGNDPEGEARMRRLDNECKVETEDET
ncbi:hypothetical protein IL306_008447 [Fusarium sp. DS 682]|nr:hypothetical protein IL306_008447 [Fusarium sp. DS 682]